jgi:hypothetical protein
MRRSHVESTLSLAIVGVVAGILVVTLLPANRLGSEDGVLRSITEQQSWAIHASMLAVLGGVVGTRIAIMPARARADVLLVAVVLIVLLASGTELGQELVAGRGPSIGDWIADLAGAGAGLAMGVRYGPSLVAHLVSDERARKPAG